MQQLGSCCITLSRTVILVHTSFPLVVSQLTSSPCTTLLHTLQTSPRRDLTTPWSPCGNMIWQLGLIGDDPVDLEMCTIPIPMSHTQRLAPPTGHHQEHHMSSTSITMSDLQWPNQVL